MVMRTEGCRDIIILDATSMQPLGWSSRSRELLRTPANQAIHFRPLLLQGRPALLPGDTIFLRHEKELDTEHGTKLLATDGTTCLLVPPVTFFTRSSGAGKPR